MVLPVRRMARQLGWHEMAETIRPWRAESSNEGNTMNEQDYPPLPAGVRVGSATYLLMKMWVNADRAQQSARHREELLAYEVTVGNLRADIALTCDFCGCETPDPWHGNTATNRHVHACDACKPKLAPAWHDAPTVPGLWLYAEGDREVYTWVVYEVSSLPSRLYQPDGETRWFGPLPEDRK